ncbi:hypothetical protein [Austwickia chelonae]|uniref:hypothetical protein n=1 Tax=Austwickia chelonae TaxID=100225 RepID=UPI000E220DF6|nr:hypothetical protein [Austwickia chelonae]
MKSRLARVGVATVAAVAMSAGLAGCGNMDPSAAAIIDGHVIKEADLDAFVKDVARVPGGTAPMAAEALSNLVIAKAVLVHAEELKIPQISADTVRERLSAPNESGQKIEGWHDSTIDAIRGIQMANALKQSPVQAQLVQRIQKAEITVNPKYGKYDRNSLSTVPSAPNWMKTPDPGQLPPGHPTMPPGHPDGGQQPPQQEAPQKPPETLPGAPAPQGDAPENQPPADNKSE